ncbi:hypothetical protein WN51_10391 [Melipona quadrifasciata]|uniref:Uncharacterized protein n=1 Tax=Melipona quadrifasciata TaxID=166423 RepID=A0A0M9A4E1_9HYME|nr:hypothetical protein WN51_10391 [Melipona quadrifasciata]
MATQVVCALSVTHTKGHTNGEFTMAFHVSLLRNVTNRGSEPPRACKLFPRCAAAVVKKFPRGPPPTRTGILSVQIRQNFQRLCSPSGQLLRFPFVVSSRIIVRSDLPNPIPQLLEIRLEDRWTSDIRGSVPAPKFRTVKRRADFRSMRRPTRETFQSFEPPRTELGVQPRRSHCLRSNVNDDDNSQPGPQDEEEGTEEEEEEEEEKEEEEEEEEEEERKKKKRRKKGKETTAMEFA